MQSSAMEGDAAVGVLLQATDDADAGRVASPSVHAQQPVQETPPESGHRRKRTNPFADFKDWDLPKFVGTFPDVSSPGFSVEMMKTEMELRGYKQSFSSNNGRRRNEKFLLQYRQAAAQAAAAPAPAAAAGEASAAKPIGATKNTVTELEVQDGYDVSDVTAHDLCRLVHSVCSPEAGDAVANTDTIGPENRGKWPRGRRGEMHV